jgi:hypothetical protein
VSILINPVLVEFACGLFIGVPFKLLIWFEGKVLFSILLTPPFGTEYANPHVMRSGCTRKLLRQINSGFVSSSGEFRGGGGILVATPDQCVSLKRDKIGAIVPPSALDPAFSVTSES